MAKNQDRHVVGRSHGNWSVQKRGDQRDSFVELSREQAEKKAREIAERQGTNPIYHDKSGRFTGTGNRNAFLHGIGGLFSFIDVLNRRLFAESPAEADAEALREAWDEVGGHLYDAMGEYEIETGIYVDRNGATWRRKRATDANSSK